MTPEIANEIMAHEVSRWRARKRRLLVTEWLKQQSKKTWPGPWHYRTDLEARPLYRGRARMECGVW